MDSIDKKLDKMLRKPENAISDDGFSEVVVSSLPEKRLGRGKCRSCTLAGAAAMGSILTLLLVPPIENVFKLYETLSTYTMLVFVIFLFMTISAVPLAWLLYSKFVGDSCEPVIPFRTEQDWERTENDKT